jgi:hypothetical protein
MCFLLSVLLRRFEPVFGYLSITLAVILFGVNSYLKRGYYPKLGHITTTFIAFLWGGMAVYVLASGYAAAVVILYSYTIMETILSIIASIAIYQRFSPVYPFLIEQIVATKPHAEKALKFIMRWEFLIACLAVLAVLNETLPIGSFYIAIVLLSIHIYMRLKSWGEAPVRLRDVLKDAKDSVVYIKDEIKKMGRNQKLKKQMVSDKVLATKSIVAEKTKLSAHSKVVKKTSTATKKNNRPSTKKSPKAKRGG